MLTSADNKFLSLTLELARKGLGTTSPNPMVGAVLVKAGRIVATGFHQRCGGPHAEVVALRKAGTRATGATLYVSLEPCDHTGRTPPCTQSIIQAGVKRVVVGMKDPNPLADGRGIRRLRNARICVELNKKTDEFSALNRIFCRYITLKLPYVIVKTGQSLDGKLATRTGASQWITGPQARQQAQQLRFQADAIMVGVNTILHDDPLLSCRWRGRVRRDKPVKVILDEKLRTPLSARIFSRESPAAVIIATTERAGRGRIKKFERSGVRVLVMPSQSNDRVDIRELMKELARRELANVLVEGGGEVIGACFDEQLVNEIYCFIAPKIIGGRDAVPVVGGTGIKTLSAAPRVTDMAITHYGDDILMRGRIEYPDTVTPIEKARA